MKMCYERIFKKMLQLYFSIWKSKQMTITSNSKCYEIDYEYDNIPYKLRFEKKRGPCKLISAFNQHNEDITSNILKYMGPSHNFYNIPTTPLFLGYTKIKVILHGGIEKEFVDNDIIKLT